MDKKDFIAPAAIIGLVGAISAYNDITHRRRMKRLKLIRNSSFPTVGAQYTALHQGFLQDPKVKEAMHIIDTTTLDDLK